MKTWIETFCLISLLFSGIYCGVFDRGLPFDTSACSLPPSIVSEIKSYKVIADSIFNESTKLQFKGKTHIELKQFVEQFGSRLSGSPQLEQSLDFLKLKLSEIGLVNVLTDRVIVPKLTRKVETGQMVLPYVRTLGILGTGSTVSTPLLGLTKQIHLIKSGDSVTTAVRNKIAVFDELGSNSTSWKLAQDLGASAILLRAKVISPTLMYAGQGERVESRKVTIPLAYITNEDVDTLRQVSGNGPVTVFVNIQHGLSTSISKNVYAEVRGRTKLNESVIISGHADTWDLSHGASDDGLGVILAYQVQALLKKLQLTPKRNIRTVFWTGEEFGLVGATEYVKRYWTDLSGLSTILEADRGCFGLSGWIFGGPTEYGCILGEILKLMEGSIGGMKLSRTVTSSDSNTPSNMKMATDIAAFFPAGVPGAELDGDTADHAYYRHHHTTADTITNVNSDMLDKCLALIATTTYIMADMNDMMPRVIN